MFFRWKRRQIFEKKQNETFFQIFEKISFIARLQPMINKAKLEANYCKAIATLIKFEIIMPYQQILQKYAYQGIFACRIHICDENSSKSYDFHEKCKKIEK